MFDIIPTPGFQHDLRNFLPSIVSSIQKAIRDYLSLAPHLPHGTRIKKLHHFRPPLYRLRSGDYRVYYRVQETKVVLLAVLNRRDAERWLSKQGSG